MLRSQRFMLSRLAGQLDDLNNLECKAVHPASFTSFPYNQSLVKTHTSFVLTCTGYLLIKPFLTSSCFKTGGIRSLVNIVNQKAPKQFRHGSEDGSTTKPQNTLSSDGNQGHHRPRRCAGQPFNGLNRLPLLSVDIGSLAYYSLCFNVYIGSCHTIFVLSV